MRLHPVARATRGFTLLELAVGIGIFLLILFGITALLSEAFQTRNVVFDQLAAQSQGQRAAQNFINELRGAVNSSIGGYPLETASSTQIVFYSNVDADTKVERVRYFLAGKELQQGVIKPTSTPLIYSVANETTSTVVRDVVTSTVPLFRYYDGAYASSSTLPLAAPVDVTKVRLVEIYLTIDRDPTRSPAAFTVQAKTALRNLKNN